MPRSCGQAEWGENPREWVTVKPSGAAGMDQSDTPAVWNGFCQHRRRLQGKSAFLCLCSRLAVQTFFVFRRGTRGMKGKGGSPCTGKAPEERLFCRTGKGPERTEI